MLGFFIITLFISGALVNLRALGKMDIARIDFMDGILIGQMYYIIIPMTFFLFTGETSMLDLPLDYRPYDDLQTTAVIIIGMFMMPGLRWLLPRTSARAPDTSDVRTFPLMVFIFIMTSVLTFLLTGMGEGGHWQENVEDAFENPLFLPIKYTANVARNAIFAVLLYRVTTNRMKLTTAALYGLVFTLFDLFTTFNRITAVYWLIMVLLMLKRKPVRMLLVGGTSLTALSFVSGIWPIFRGLATQRGYNLESFAYAWDLAQRATSKTGSTLDSMLNGVFESSNLIVLNWVVNNFGSSERPYLVYAMFVRPMTVLLPTSVWPERPSTVGVTLGTAIAGKSGLALNSTMYGEAFANFAWFWPLGLGLFLTASHLVFRALAPNSRIMQMIGAFTAIAFWRFDSSYVGSTAMLLSLLVAGMWLMRLSSSPKRKQFFSTSRDAS